MQKPRTFNEVTAETILCYGGTHTLPCSVLHYTSIITYHTYGGIYRQLVPSIYRNSASNLLLLMMSRICNFSCSEQWVRAEWGASGRRRNRGFYSDFRINPLSTLKFSPLADRNRKKKIIGHHFELIRERSFVKKLLTFARINNKIMLQVIEGI